MQPTYMCKPGRRPVIIQYGVPMEMDDREQARCLAWLEADKQWEGGR